MKQYRLKKELPTFKAGDIFEISQNGNLVKRGECISDCIVTYTARTLEKFPNILADWFEEIPEEPKTVWDLGKGDDAWFIAGGGVKKYVSMEEIELALFRGMVEVGDGFTTKEEAKKELARRKAKQILLRDTKGFKPDWNDRCQEKYVAYFDHDWGRLETDFWCTYHSQPSLYFATQADAKASIKVHEKEWKTYLGVEGL